MVAALAQGHPRGPQWRNCRWGPCVLERRGSNRGLGTRGVRQRRGNDGRRGRHRVRSNGCRKPRVRRVRRPPVRRHVVVVSTTRSSWPRLLMRMVGWTISPVLKASSSPSSRSVKPSASVLVRAQSAYAAPFAHRKGGRRERTGTSRSPASSGWPSQTDFPGCQGLNFVLASERPRRVRRQGARLGGPVQGWTRRFAGARGGLLHLRRPRCAHAMPSRRRSSGHATAR